MRVSGILLLVLLLAGCRAEADYLKDSESLAVLFGLLRQGRVVDQGPVKCYDASDEFDCPLALFPGQDGQYIGVPKPRSISAAIRRLNGDLISRDYGTGLVWTSCPLDTTGAPINDAICTPPPPPPLTYGSFNQAVARGHCNALNQRSYGGMTGWRLPSIRELLSLAIFDSSKIDQAAFPGGQNTLTLWSDSTRGAGRLYFSSDVFSVTPDNGNNNLRARCVSGVPLRTGNFRVISGSSVLDMDTGLVFTRCSAGQNDPDCTGSPETKSWQQALQYCDSLSKDGRRWRLPAFHEMMVVFQIDADTPFDSEAFPNAPGIGSYWTSTTDPGNNDAAIKIDLPITVSSPIITSANKANTSYALCVSGPD
jgi:hypothetical protein